MAYLVGMAIKKTIGIRVTAGQEEDGLDIAAHGIPAYNELERFSDTNPAPGFRVRVPVPVAELQNNPNMQTE
jgi:Amt family ammonium transporter